MRLGVFDVWIFAVGETTLRRSRHERRLPGLKPWAVNKRSFAAFQPSGDANVQAPQINLLASKRRASTGYSLKENLLFPCAVWEKACTTISENLVLLRRFSCRANFVSC